MVYTDGVWTYLFIGVEVSRKSQHGSQGHQEKHNLEDRDILLFVFPLYGYTHLNISPPARPSRKKPGTEAKNYGSVCGVTVGVIIKV